MTYKKPVLSHVKRNLGPGLSYVHEDGEQKDHNEPSDRSNIGKNSTNLRVQKCEKQAQSRQGQEETKLDKSFLLTLNFNSCWLLCVEEADQDLVREEV